MTLNVPLMLTSKAARGKSWQCRSHDAAKWKTPSGPATRRAHRPGPMKRDGNTGFGVIENDFEVNGPVDTEEVLHAVETGAWADHEAAAVEQRRWDLGAQKHAATRDDRVVSRIGVEGC